MKESKNDVGMERIGRHNEGLLRAVITEGKPGGNWHVTKAPGWEKGKMVGNRQG
jgi:hypothetical protein